ncbi:MAG: hypothetical protein V2I24_15805 [Halieaceae bacterium]|nr:hypothetical protein [Halieaceae bacterium]
MIAGLGYGRGPVRADWAHASLYWTKEKGAYTFNSRTRKKHQDQDVETRLIASTEAVNREVVQAQYNSNLSCKGVGWPFRGQGIPAGQEPGKERGYGLPLFVGQEFGFGVVD